MKDIPFPGLREHYRKQGMKSLMLAKIIRYSNRRYSWARSVRRVALVNARPAFVQGLTACAEIGEAMAQAVVSLHPVLVSVFRLIKCKAISINKLMLFIKAIADSGSNIVFPSMATAKRTLSPS